MKYVPIPVNLLPMGVPMPVDICSSEGVLLLRRGQSIRNAGERDRLHDHKASAREHDALAWQRAYENMVHDLLMSGMDMREVSRRPMPHVIRERDFEGSAAIQGGWLDIQEVLRGILYQGGLAINPVPRLLAIENKASELLESDADGALFSLFQALGDGRLGYTATHALLCATIGELAGQLLEIDALQRRILLSAALAMNIGMARDQDALARQRDGLSIAQRKLIQQHPERSVHILQKWGIHNEVELDLVRWHHHPQSHEALPDNLQLRRLLHTVDVFVAKMASRRTRKALSPLESAKTIYLQIEHGVKPSITMALAATVGFYPPGTYVRLNSGELAVVAQRGVRVNTPWVIVLLNKEGMPTLNYHCVDTSEPAFSIRSPATLAVGKVTVNQERVRRARHHIKL